MYGPLELQYTPTNPADAVNKSYVDNLFHDRFYDAPMDGQAYGLILNNWSPVVPITGALMRGPINMMGFRLTGLPWPHQPTDAVSKDYLDHFLSSIVAAEFGVFYGPHPPANPLIGMVWTTPEANMFAWTGHIWLQVAGFDQSGPVSPGGGGGMTYSPTPPLGPVIGEGWATPNAELFVWTGLIWLQLVGPDGGGGDVWSHFGAVPPPAPMTGMLWTNLSAMQFIWDGVAWLQVTGADGGGGGPGGGIPDAPMDGRLYVRNGLAQDWIVSTVVTDGGTF